jgi:WD40 repeat protein
MRELHAWYVDRRLALGAAADIPAARTCATPKHKVLRDPADRAARHREYRELVEATEAKYIAGQINPELARPDQPQGETRQVNSLAFSQNGESMAASDGDGTARLWNVSYLVNALPRLCSQVGGLLTRVERVN